MDRGRVAIGIESAHQVSRGLRPFDIAGLIEAVAASGMRLIFVREGHKNTFEKEPKRATT
jgi:hypothetical protein